MGHEATGPVLTSVALAGLFATIGSNGVNDPAASITGDVTKVALDAVAIAVFAIEDGGGRARR